MKGTGAGWDSILYRIYLIGGLAGIVAVTVGTVILGDPQRAPMLPVYAGGGCASIFVLGFIVYWWVQLLFGGYADPTRPAAAGRGDPPEIGALRSWSALFEKMAEAGGDRQALDAARRRARGPLLEWFGWATALTLFPLVSVWLLWFGVFSQRAFVDLVGPAVVVLAIAMLVRTYFMLGGWKRDDQSDIYAPLGLRAALRPDGRQRSLKLEGERLGRRVEISVQSGGSTTRVTGRIAEFNVTTREGAFVLNEALPTGVRAGLRDLRRAYRWKGIKLQGGADGVSVTRERRGARMWLYDLWLAERIMGCAQAGEDARS
jgi:hypothetical protein